MEKCQYLGEGAFYLLTSCSFDALDLHSSAGVIDLTFLTLLSTAFN